MKLRTFAICGSLVMGALTFNANPARANSSSNPNLNANQVAAGNEYNNRNNRANFYNRINNRFGLNGGGNRNINPAALNIEDAVFPNMNRQNGDNPLNEVGNNFNPNPNRNGGSRVVNNDLNDNSN